ncbi:hypothetical protein M438DRAFT_354723 [Aureobasidium pullulans EXF-150]|uniref:Ribonuclease H2 subunit B n=1 Tax=Aureobasidium pullulans EXF-150 TaxID=1043002 RepID=A0A074XJJ0_AURPU|nr:uncharacterized protein M438DRAFT_354723 [Aureobasidium pullulans EXF-150]KEQ85680.1 hypothetical protein M438DRAFT_354723 [Aureobasidium pullulans EXF-150]
MKTRATKTSAKAAEVVEEKAIESATLEPSSNNPPLLFVLPEGASPDARVVTLPNPATSGPTRYFFCPEKGIHEFTKVAAPKKTPRSWLVAPDASASDSSADESLVSKGYTVENADLFVATPVDPLFILLPALMPAPDSHEQLFLTIDDHLDKLAEEAKHLTHLIRSIKIQESFEKRADAVCDNVDLGHEKMFRLSNEKLLTELVKKANRMAANGLPASIESHFVQEALRIPMMAVQRTESQEEEASPPTIDTDSTTPSTSANQSQVSAVTEATSLTSAPESAPANVTSLLRLRTALNLLLSTYIPSALHTPLNTLLKSSSSPVDFAPLECHLSHIADQKRRAQALRSLSDNISRKRSGVNDEEAEEREATKRRKKEEDEAKKKNTSRGVKQLGKVNTTGMMKLSSFFTKAPAKN